MKQSRRRKLTLHQQKLMAEKWRDDQERHVDQEAKKRFLAPPYYIAAEKDHAAVQI